MSKYILQVYKPTDGDWILYHLGRSNGMHMHDTIIGKWFIDERMGYVNRNGGLNRTFYEQMDVFLEGVAIEYNILLKELTKEEPF